MRKPRNNTRTITKSQQLNSKDDMVGFQFERNAAWKRTYH